VHGYLEYYIRQRQLVIHPERRLEMTDPEVEAKDKEKPLFFAELIKRLWFKLFWGINGKLSSLLKQLNKREEQSNKRIDTDFQFNQARREILASKIVENIPLLGASEAQATMGTSALVSTRMLMERQYNELRRLVSNQKFPTFVDVHVEFKVQEMSEAMPNNAAFDPSTLSFAHARSGRGADTFHRKVNVVMQHMKENVHRFVKNISKSEEQLQNHGEIVDVFLASRILLFSGLVQLLDQTDADKDLRTMRQAMIFMAVRTAQLHNQSLKEPALQHRMIIDQLITVMESLQESAQEQSAGRQNHDSALPFTHAFPKAPEVDFSTWKDQCITSLQTERRQVNEILYQAGRAKHAVKYITGFASATAISSAETTPQHTVH